MMLAFVAMLVAFILFILAAVGVPGGRFNLIAAGLAFMALSFCLQLYPA